MQCSCGIRQIDDTDSPSAQIRLQSGKVRRQDIAYPAGGHRGVQGWQLLCSAEASLLSHR